MGSSGNFELWRLVWASGVVCANRPLFRFRISARFDHCGEDAQPGTFLAIGGVYHGSF